MLDYYSSQYINILNSVKSDLDSNRLVMFVGHSSGGCIAKYLFDAIQIELQYKYSSCNVPKYYNFQLMTFGTQSCIITSPTQNRYEKVGRMTSIVNSCDFAPFGYNNATGNQFFSRSPHEYLGYTYILYRNSSTVLVSDDDIYNLNYSPCELGNDGYNIELSNYVYYGKRSFVGYTTGQVGGTTTTTTITTTDTDTTTTTDTTDTNNSSKNHNGFLKHFLNNTSIIEEEEKHNIGSLIINSTGICERHGIPTTRIDWRGPTKSQLSKYYKLLSYSYYPNFPMNADNSNIYPIILSILQDQQISGYLNINNYNATAQYIQVYNRMFKFVNYVNPDPDIREYVISVVPVNLTVPYYYYTCNRNLPYSVNKLMPVSIENSNSNNWKLYFSSSGSGPGFGSGIFTTNITEYNLETSYDLLNTFIQNVNSYIIPHFGGARSDWTITFISKDVGNNVVLGYLFKYWYNSIRSESLGGVNRYKIQESGYKFFQTLGFGNILDKYTTYTSWDNHFNLIGKNIFTTVSIENDLLSTPNFINTQFRTEGPPCYSPDPVTGYWSIYCKVGGCRKFFGSTDNNQLSYDKWHRNIIYDQNMNLIQDLNQYKCSRYRQVVAPDASTLLLADYNNYCLRNRTIVREYFGIPNYFYNSSVWRCTSDSTQSCSIINNYSGLDSIDYNNVNNCNLCQTPHDYPA